MFDKKTSGSMKYSDLPPKYQHQARCWAIDAWNELYSEQGLPLIDGAAPEVEQLLADWEFEIVSGSYEPGVRYERLERI